MNEKTMKICKKERKSKVKKNFKKSINQRTGEFENYIWKNEEKKMNA